MAKSNRFWRNALLLCLSVCFCLALVACGGDDTTGSTAEPTKGTSTYTIKVSTASAIDLTGLSVYVYADKDLQELETMKQLDADGCATFTAETGLYFVVVMGVPEGYQVEKCYTFDSTNQANIVLTSSVITGTEKPSDKFYALGDIMYDFSITASDGTEYVLSELLKEKNAVVLNFWYLNCNPCKIEFPYLQQAYAEYSDRIELLAINCEDGNDASLNAFAAENELTFPMAIGDKNYWCPAAYTACPTTIVVDRYGTIVYMHTGYFDEVAPFNALFRMVTGDDYSQTLIQDLKSMVTEDDYRRDGSPERPYELGGMTEFDVKVPADGVVYYNLYRLDNITMRIENPNAYVIIDGETHYPVDGVIEMKVSSPDTFSPLYIGFGNSSSVKDTIHVQFVFSPGNINNPVPLRLGENNIGITNVNGLGTYYSYEATADGKLQITVLEVTANAVADIHLYNKTSQESVYLSYDGTTDENGNRVISIDVKAGDSVQIIFSASTIDPEIEVTYANIKALASILEGEGSGIIDDGRTGYYVTVVDQLGNPIPDVKMSLSAGSQSAILTTDENGVISIRLTEDAYFLELLVPTGYYAETTSYLWSPVMTHLEICLLATADFRVQLQQQDGTALPGVLVRVYADVSMEQLMQELVTDSEGTVTFTGYLGSEYYLVLVGVDPQLQVQPMYRTEGENTILILEPVQDDSVVGLGDAMPNFTLADIDGNVHSLQLLLNRYDVVLLTFFKTASTQSVANLINLQAVYETYGDRVAVLALDPADKLQMEVTIFRELHHLTFPIAQCDEALAESLGVSDYPTTVVVDREGKISLIHNGVISSQEFTMIFDFYLNPDYIHTPVYSLDELLGRKNRAN